MFLLATWLSRRGVGSQTLHQINFGYYDQIEHICCTSVTWFNFQGQVVEVVYSDLRFVRKLIFKGSFNNIKTNYELWLLY